MKRIPVKEFMNRNPVKVREDLPLTEFVALISAHKLRGVPVVDEAGALVGVISETDLFIKPKGIPFSLEKVPSLLGQVIDKEDVDQVDATHTVKVGEVMSIPPHTVGQDTTLEDLSMLMYEKHLTLVPVVEDGKLIGTVRRIDVLRQIYS